MISIVRVIKIYFSIELFILLFSIVSWLSWLSWLSWSKRRFTICTQMCMSRGARKKEVLTEEFGGDLLLSDLVFSIWFYRFGFIRYGFFKIWLIRRLFYAMTPKLRNPKIFKICNLHKFRNSKLVCQANFLAVC